MHDVDHLLKQQEIAWVGSYASTDKYAVELFLMKFCLKNRFCRFSKIGQTCLHVVSKISQFLLG